MPFLPTDIKGCKLWLKPRLHWDDVSTVPLGQTILLWEDEGGNHYDFSGGTVEDDYGPKLGFGSNLLPEAQFFGNEHMEGPDVNLFQGTGPKALFIAMTIRDLTDGQTVFCDSNGNWAVTIETVAGPPDQAVVPRFRGTTTGGPTVETEPLTLGPHVVMLQHFGGSLRIGLDDPFPDEIKVTANISNLGTALLGEDNNGLEPLLGGNAIVSIAGYNVGMQEREVSKVMSFMRNLVLTCGDPLAQLRDGLSRRLTTYERSRVFVRMDLPLEFLDQNLLEPHAISHEEMPGFTPQGAGLKRWQRRAMNLYSRQEDVGGYRLTEVFADRQEVGHMYREIGPAEQPSDSSRDGAAISGLGVRRLYNHTTTIYAPNLAGHAVEVRPGLEPGGVRGIFQEPLSKNYLLRNYFASGLTGLTPSGDVDEIDHSAGTGERFYFGHRRSPTNNQLELITQFHARLSEGASDASLTWPPSSPDAIIPADQWLCFSARVFNVGGPCYWAIQNDVDGKYINNLTGAWDVAFTKNESQVFDSDIGLLRSNPFKWPGSPGQATLSLWMPNGVAVPGSSVDVFFVQLEPLTFPTSPMLANTAFVDSRGACTLGWIESGEHNVIGAGVHLFNEGRGSVGIKATAPWSMADLASGEYVIDLLTVGYETDFPTSDYWRVRIDGPAQQIQFDVASAGVPQTVAVFDSPEILRDTEFRIVIRQTSEDEGEEDLPANTLDIFFNGERGTPGQLNARPLIGTELFSRVRMDLFGATCRHLESSYRVWPQEKCEVW